MVQLTDELVSRLDEASVARGVSRSELIREVLMAFLKVSGQDEISRQIVAGYERIPAGALDEWGDLEAQVDGETSALLKTLDAEERRAGLEPWPDRPQP